MLPFTYIFSILRLNYVSFFSLAFLLMFGSYCWRNRLEEKVFKSSLKTLCINGADLGRNFCFSDPLTAVPASVFLILCVHELLSFFLKILIPLRI